eukprot:360870-Chlamydomonas_euryale.AAC.31
MASGGADAAKRSTRNTPALQGVSDLSDFETIGRWLAVTGRLASGLWPSGDAAVDLHVGRRAVGVDCNIAWAAAPSCCTSLAPPKGTHADAPPSTRHRHARHPATSLRPSWSSSLPKTAVKINRNHPVHARAGKLVRAGGGVDATPPLHLSAPGWQTPTCCAPLL